MARTSLVCLANSLKGNGYCFAGIDPEGTEWIRPIGSGWDGAVMKSEQQLGDGTLPELLEVVSVPLKSPVPQPGQPENWKLGSGAWKREGSLTRREAMELLDSLVTDDALFGTSGKSVSPSDFKDLSSSLAVVRPTAIAWEKRTAKKLYVEFEHAGTRLNLKVSDPVCFEHFRADPVGTYSWRQDWIHYLIVSLTVSEWHGAHWKLVAGVVGFERE